MFKKACHRFIQQLCRYKTIFEQLFILRGYPFIRVKIGGSDDYVIKGGGHKRQNIDYVIYERSLSRALSANFETTFVFIFFPFKLV